MINPVPFGKYQLLERVNIGGMAEVFCAKAFGVEGFERVLAIKRILPNMADDDEFINMFVDEARISVQLSHPSIVQIYELGKFESQYYIAMEYVAGRDLRQLLDRYRQREEVMDVQTAAFITSRICEGLDYAHAKLDAAGRPMNIVHRDVSPQNILISFDGAVKITDFGIAKAEDRASKTQAGVLKGKFCYMSPEQVRGLEIDNRSDIFAVGILLYEMVTGARLFVGQSDFSTLEKVRRADVEPPRQINAEIPAELERIMLKALARDRDERYLRASDLHDDLQQFLIADNAIYNGKRLAALMAEEWAEAIEKEARRQEEYARVSPPHEMDFPQPASRASLSESGERLRNDEKTMVFESDFGFAGSQQITELQPALGDLSRPSTSAASAPPYPVSRGERARSARASASRSSAAGSHRGRHGYLEPWHLFAIAVSLLGFTSALDFILLAATANGYGSGTLQVITSPEIAHIYLDGDLVAVRSPYEQEIRAGEHVLVARAEGYQDKAYRFNLPAGRRAQIQVQMQQADPEAGAAALLEVVSQPAGAAVTVRGVEVGTTPLILRDQDPTRPVTVELRKPGFETEVASATFEPGQEKAVLRVVLTPAQDGSATKANSKGDGGGESTRAEPKADASLAIKSRPAGAEVWVDGTLRGSTPLVVEGLRRDQRAKVVVIREGFRRFEKTVTLDGGGEVSLNVRLRPRQSASVACGGAGGALSVMPVGMADCLVTVGDNQIGVAPMFKHPAPLGRCPIVVTCPDGRSLKVVRNIRAGAEEKVIIRPGDWKKGGSRRARP